MKARIQRRNKGPLTTICPDCGGGCDAILAGLEEALGLTDPRKQVFARAIELGWPGRVPAPLDTFYAQRELEAAQRFLDNRRLMQVLNPTGKEGRL